MLSWHDNSLDNADRSYTLEQGPKRATLLCPTYAFSDNDDRAASDSLSRLAKLLSQRGGGDAN